jgi:hypothetical protein
MGKKLELALIDALTNGGTEDRAPIYIYSVKFISFVWDSLGSNYMTNLLLLLVCLCIGEAITTIRNKKY